MRSLLNTFIFLLAASVLHGQTVLDSAVNFTVKDINGLTHHLNDYLEQDKIVVIDFFTITCGPCITYAPLINESYTHFGCNTSNVVFLGINWGADNAGVANFGDVCGVHYPEVSGTEGNGNTVAADYGIISFPTVILILPDWNVAEKYIWPPSTEHLDSIILSYGGVGETCNTPVSGKDEIIGHNRILSMFPVPAHNLLTCTTSVYSPASIEVYSLTGNRLIPGIRVLPSSTTRIPTENLSDGFYLLVLRSAEGTITDRKPFLVQNH